MDFRIRRVLEILNSDLHVEVSFKDLAKSLNLSTSRLRHLFKEEVGISPKQFVRKVKLKKAKLLLEETNYSIKEIGARVGLHDESHFVRDFEAAFGQTPSRYRETYQQQQTKTEGVTKHPNRAEVLMTYAVHNFAHRASQLASNHSFSGNIVSANKSNKAKRVY